MQGVAWMELGCVILAAGRGIRFGGDKLSAAVQGKSLLRHALETVPAGCFKAVAVVVRERAAAALAEDFGFFPVWNRQPEAGLSLSLRLGLGCLDGCGGVLFQVADQPFLRRETVAGIVGLFLRHPDRIVAAGCRGVRGNPCLFPAEFFPALLALRGDQGGSAVIRRHPERLLLYEAEAVELRDIDTPEDMDALPGG